MIKRTLMASALVLACLTGCNTSDPEVLAQRERFVLESEPADPLPVLEVREQAASGTAADAMAPAVGTVVVVGQIGGLPNPWIDGKAAFMIADPSLLAETEGEHACTDDSCPFCRRRAAANQESLALVEFRTPEGQPLEIDARKLFDIAPRQTVVVRGQPKLDESGYLVISAEGLYIRR